MAQGGLYIKLYEPVLSNSFGEKLETLQTAYELINVFATQQFRSFRWLVFPSLLLAKR